MEAGKSETDMVSPETMPDGNKYVRPSPDGNAKSATIWHRCHESARGRIDRRADNRDLRVGSVSLRFQGIRTLSKLRLCDGPEIRNTIWKRRVVLRIITGHRHACGQRRLDASSLPGAPAATPVATCNFGAPRPTA